jgi:hypothetical protein
MKNYLQILLLLFVFGCSQKKEKKVIITENKTYKQSEMAALMLKMYAFNLENKSLILEGKTPTAFPEEFANIHKAQLTDPSDRNASFKVFSDLYLATFQQDVKIDEESLKEKHNTTIYSCIACHKTTCIGPIPKIKKLLIQ